MRGGLCYSEAMNRRKKFLSIEEQVSLIQRRGLILPSEKSAKDFLVKSWVVVYLFSNLGLVSWRWFRGHLGDKG